MTIAGPKPCCQSKLSFAHDVNLGFPTNNPRWQEFFAAHNCTPVAYADLARLTQDLKTAKLTAAFLPAANDYFLREAATYHGIATALSGKSGAATASSLLVVPRALPVTDISQLQGKRLGRINGYCTTSYFAAAILLQRHGYSIKNFFSEILNVGAWQKQIDAVIAGIVDATMVDEDTWLAQPGNAVLTRVLDRVDQLPGPIVIARSDAPELFLVGLKTQLLSEPRNPDALFSGFVDYEEATDRQFVSDAALAFAA